MGENKYRIINHRLTIKFYMEDYMNIKRILTTLIGFPLVTLIIIYGNKYLMDCLIGIIACIAIHEYFKLDKNSELKKISWVGYLIAIMISLDRKSVV